MATTNIRGSQIADGANGVDLTVDVTGILPVANGGTGVASLGALTSDIVPNANNTYNLGTLAKAWLNGYFSSAAIFNLNLYQNNSPFTGHILLQNNSASTDKVVTFPDASGVADVDQFITLTSAYTLANNTSLQKLFNSPTNGAVTLPANTTYFFECCFSLTGLSGSTHSVGFGFGGSNITRQAWWADAVTAALATPSTVQRTFNTAANTTLVTAGTTTTASVMIHGKLVIGAGGTTLVPQVQQTTAATAACIVGIDSYFRIWAHGADTVQSAGAWT